MSQFNEITFSDSDIVNADDWRAAGESHPSKTYLLSDHGFTLAVVFADCEQDAIDIACDAGKLDRYEVTAEELADYGATDAEQSERLSYLGNNGKAHDIETLCIVELPSVKRLGFCAAFDATTNK